MKSVLLVMLFCLCTTICLSQKAIIPEEYEGFINSKWKIYFTVTPGFDMKGDLLSYAGYYSYASSSGRLNLTGKINIKTGQFAFTERNAQNKITGYFNGWKKGNVVTGTWTSYDQKKNYPFVLEMK